MKRHGHLWDKLTSFPNLVRAADAARKGKRHRPNVARFDFELEKELCRLQDELRGRTYVPGEYRSFLIHEPKARLISAAPYRDRVVHHALVRVLAPVFEPTFIFASYACRPGKGTHAAVDRFTALARRYRYVLKCDVRKYFPSIDHEVLKGLVARKIKDRDVLWLVNRIIDGSNPQEEVQFWFPGDDLWTPLERRRGLPIGNQTSQFFANVYLNPFDHWVQESLRAPCYEPGKGESPTSLKRQRRAALSFAGASGLWGRSLRAGGYIRYMDDFVLFSDDKGWLAEAREQCRTFLASLRLRLHPDKSVISRVEDGTRFLGFFVYPDHRRLPRANVVRMKRRVRRLQAGYAAGELSWADVYGPIMSWMGHARHADTYRLRERLFADVAFKRKAV